jgi:2-polyprenyl-3-methyl-5-hydroxy-6-metoxy-1,4-benzoquinol methylase
MSHTPGHAELSHDELAAVVDSFNPWWMPFRLRNGDTTIDTTSITGRVNLDNYLFRLDLINGTLVELLGGEIATTSVLDIGCNAGFFSLDLAARGAQRVDGLDLRDANIDQARFLAEHYGIENVAFHVSDADDVAQGLQYDVVLNLGLLYHVVNPLQHLRQTYELCSRYAIIDSVCHTEPVAAFMLFGDKDNDHPFEGRDEWEFHPTYRGAIEAIRYAGFSDVIEIIGDSDLPHKAYAAGKRRCFLAIK